MSVNTLPSLARRMKAGPAGLIALGLAIGTFLFVLARLADLIMMVFASVLVALLLLALAGVVQRRLHVGRTVALVLVLAILSGAVVGMSALLGAQLSAQLSSLAVLLPRSWHAFEGSLGRTAIGAMVLEQLRSAKLPDNFMITWATRLVGNFASGLVAALIVIFGALYLAFHPETYRGGLLRLFPKPHRPRAGEVLDAIRRALTQWLVGQTVSMCFVASTTSVGLWLAGVPAPLALGVLAGLGHTVPVIGPWATAAPGLLVAATRGPQTLGVAFGIYLVAAQIESNLLMPLVLRRMSEVPMAVTLFAVVAMGMLFGALGVLLATPLAVLAYVLVRTVYLEDVLGDRPEEAAISSRPRTR